MKKILNQFRMKSLREDTKCRRSNLKNRLLHGACPEQSDRVRNDKMDIFEQFLINKVIIILTVLIVISPLLFADTISITPRNISDNSVADGVNFGTVTVSDLTRFVIANQYLDINFSLRSSLWEMKIYTNNFKGVIPSTTTWGFQAGGMIGSLPGDRVSLAWNAEQQTGNVLQPGDPTKNTVTGWTFVKDIADQDIPETKFNDESWAAADGYPNIAFGGESFSNIVTPDNPPTNVQPINNNTFFVYLQGDFLANADQYATTLFFDLVNIVSFKVPTINHTPLTEVNMLGDQIVLPVDVVSTETPISDVRLLYRKKGDQNFKTVVFSPLPKVNITLYNGTATIPRQDVTLSGLEYHIETNDGGRFPASGEISVTVNTTVSATIGPEGGKVIVADGNITDGETMLDIPAGALNQPTKITIEQVDVQTAPDGSGFAGSLKPVSAFKFSPEGLQFQKPVTFSMLYLDLNGDTKVEKMTNIAEFNTEIPADKLRLFWQDGFDWRLVGGNIDKDKKIVTTKINHFTLYALFPATLALDPSAYRPKERIITPASSPGTNDIAHFDNLNDKNVTIKIFDITGRKIRSIEQFPYEWDGRDDDGRIVESGAYIYQFKVEGQLISGTIVVAK